MTLEEVTLYLQRLELRFETVESVLNSVQQAMLNLATQEQLRRINLIRQTEIDDLKEQITGILNEIALIKAEVFK